MGGAWRKWRTPSAPWTTLRGGLIGPFSIVVLSRTVLACVHLQGPNTAEMHAVQR